MTLNQASNDIYNIETEFDKVNSLFYSKDFNLILNDEKREESIGMNFLRKLNLCDINNNILDSSENLTNENNKIKENSSRKESFINLRRRKRPKKELKKEENKKIHTYKDDDNILRKIQVHFLSFIINCTNEVVKSLCLCNGLIDNSGIPYFVHLDYELKKVVNHRYVEDLKKKTIGDIVQFKATSKAKKLKDKNINIKTYDYIKDIIPSINNFFQKSYLSIFKDYYFPGKKCIDINGQIIPLSNKTQTFKDLIKKYYTYQDRIIKVSIKYYLKTYIRKKNKKKKIFKTFLCNETKNE